MANPIEYNLFIHEKITNPEPLVSSGVLYRGGKIVIYGKYKSMKSMLAQRLAICLANGEPWIGFDTLPQGVPVLYLQLEIPAPLMQKRLLKTGKVKLKQQLFLWNEHFLKIDNDVGLKRLAEQVKLLKPAVLIIDPVYKVVGGDLLSTQHIQQLVDYIDLLIADCNVAVVMVHHTRKGIFEDWGSDDMLGSVIFSAWADSVIKIERKGLNITVKFEVMRHAEDELEPREFIFTPELDFVNPVLVTGNGVPASRQL